MTPPVAPPPPVRATGARRWLYVCLGLFFVGVGFLGAVLPVLPHTPFFLLASYFFARSSPRLDRWLRRSPYIGHLIRDWHDHRGLRPRVKATAVCLVAAVIGYTVGFSPAPVWAKWCAAGLAAVGVCVILFVVPTVRTPGAKTKTGGGIPARDPGTTAERPSDGAQGGSPG